MAGRVRYRLPGGDGRRQPAAESVAKLHKLPPEATRRPRSNRVIGGAGLILDEKRPILIGPIGAFPGDVPIALNRSALPQILANLVHPLRFGQERGRGSAFEYWAADGCAEDTARA